MAILIVYLTVAGFVSLFAFILLFYYFTGCISHLCLIVILNKISVFTHLEAATGRSANCSKSGLNQLKYACESVPLLLKL